VFAEKIERAAKPLLEGEGQKTSSGGGKKKKNPPRALNQSNRKRTVSRRLKKGWYPLVKKSDESHLIGEEARARRKT